MELRACLRVKWRTSKHPSHPLTDRNYRFPENSTQHFVIIWYFHAHLLHFTLILWGCTCLFHNSFLNQHINHEVKIESKWPVRQQPISLWNWTKLPVLNWPFSSNYHFTPSRFNAPCCSHKDFSAGVFSTMSGHVCCLLQFLLSDFAPGYYCNKCLGVKCHTLCSQRGLALSPLDTTVQVGYVRHMFEWKTSMLLLRSSRSPLDSSVSWWVNSLCSRSYFRQQRMLKRVCVGLIALNFSHPKFGV